MAFPLLCLEYSNVLDISAKRFPKFYCKAQLKLLFPSIGFIYTANKLVAGLKGCKTPNLEQYSYLL